jgi:hypothetical protein
MRYMLLIYTNENGAEGVSPADIEQVKAGHRAVLTDAKERGVLIAADPLERTSTATTVRVRDGKLLTSDGPFAETKEQLAGYYILDCKDLDEAIGWAARIPSECGGFRGSIEIRPIRAMTIALGTGGN